MIPLSFVRAALDGARVDPSSKAAAIESCRAILGKRLQGVSVERSVQFGKGVVLDLLVDHRWGLLVRLGALSAEDLREEACRCLSGLVDGLIVLSETPVRGDQDVGGKVGIFIAVA